MDSGGRSEFAMTSSSGEPWRVGVLFSKTGYMSVIEETQLRGTLLAIDELNEAGGINGRPIQPVVYDPSSEASAFGRYAKKLLIEDGISTIFGCYTSSSRKAVLPVVERLNGLLWYPTLYEGFEFSPNVIYTGAGPNQNSLELFRYLMETHGKRFYFIGSDYVYPRVSNRIMREFVRANSAQVVGERYVALRPNRAEFYDVMRDIRELRPDAIFSTVVGDGTVFLYQAYAECGFDARTMPIASLTTTEAEVSAMGADVGEGHVTAAPYFQGVESDQNHRFLRRWKKIYGDDFAANMCSEAAYFQVSLFAQALRATNSLETESLRPAVLGLNIDAPQGQISINPMCGHANLWARIGRVNRAGQFDIIRQSSAAVNADPYLVGYGRNLAFS
jgi:ABC-type branched-subunit amino acid transport system substrate-binding protein